MYCKRNNIRDAKSLLKKIALFLYAMMICIWNSVQTLATGGGKIASSDLGKGIKNIITDLSSFALVLAPIVGVVCIIYFAIRRSSADEMDQKKWNNRIVTAIVSVILAVVASATLTVITGYFN